jgi:hypothetical protein
VSQKEIEIVAADGFCATEVQRNRKDRGRWKTKISDGIDEKTEKGL